jgi:hypothetical protein
VTDVTFADNAEGEIVIRCYRLALVYKRREPVTTLCDDCATTMR